MKKYITQWLRDIRDILEGELRLIFGDSGVLIIFCFAGLVYPLLYNLIYANGVVDDMPIAVVNHSHGAHSRRFIRALDATRECAVAYGCATLEEARQLMEDQKVHGIVYFPGDFDARIVQGGKGILSTYADMSAFFYYKNLSLGTSFVMLSQMRDIQAERYAAAGFAGQDAVQLIQPVQYNDTRLYNPNISYTMFFVYMALFMILQQAMFYGSSTLSGTMREKGRSPALLLGGRGVGRILLGRGTAYMLVFLTLGVYGAILVPHLFHLPMHARWQDILLLLVFYVADVALFCFTWSSAVAKRETVLVLFLFVSPIAVFLTGFTWPATSFPVFWKVVSYVFPSTFGCKAYMTLVSSGSLSAITPELRALTIQGVVYYLLAAGALNAENHIIAHREKWRALREKLDLRRGMTREETRRIIAGTQGGEQP